MKLVNLLLSLNLALAAPVPFSFGWSWSWGVGNGQSSSGSQTLDSAGCVNLITTNAYKIGNLTESVGSIASSVQQNQIFTLLKLQTTTTDLIKAIQDAGSSVNSSCGNLTLAEALPLVTVLQALLPPTNATMTTLQQKKSTVFDHAVLYAISLSWLVKSDLDQVISAIYGFAYAIRSKTPSSAYQIVDNLSSQLLAPVVQTEQIFADNDGLIDLSP